MSTMLQECSNLLTAHGFAATIQQVPAENEEVALTTVVFESSTVLGFILIYDKPKSLIQSWQSDSSRITMRFREMLRSSEQKAWNAYLVLIAEEPASFSEAQQLGQIEEDLVAMRKITKAGVSGSAGAYFALLPLLPFRAAPSLDPISMRDEIRMRTSELTPEVVEAFLSDADAPLVHQLIEDLS